MPYAVILEVYARVNPQIACLIVSFARPDSLSQIVSECLTDPNRRVYLFIDRANGSFVLENQQVVDIALSFTDHPNVHVRIATKPHGPQRGVAAGLAWAFEKEDELVVIEDDTILNSHTLRFFEETRHLLSREVGILCSLSIPAIDDSRKFSCQSGHFSPFALTNCWMLEKQLWLESIKPIQLSDLVSMFSGSFNRLSSYLFFLSGALRFDNSLGKTGWDSKMQFSLIKKDLKAFMPGSNLSGNSGNDHVASNSKVPAGSSGIHWEIEESPSALKICESKECNQQIIKVFESYFRISWRSYFSPLKTMGLITKNSPHLWNS